MKIFISWSKDRSKLFAQAFKEFLQGVLSFPDPFLSTHIASGDQWFATIMDKLSEAGQGVICLTPENKDSPWMMFEAGAIMKGIQKARIHILLLGLDESDITVPLSMFQLKLADQEGIWDVLESINLSSLNPEKPEIFRIRFEALWPKLNDRIAEILAIRPDIETVKRRDDSDILNEILGLVRSINNERLVTLQNQVADLTFETASNQGPFKINLIHFDRVMRSFREKGIDPTSSEAFDILVHAGHDSSHIMDFMRSAANRKNQQIVIR